MKLWTSQGNDEKIITNIQLRAGPGMARAPQSPKTVTSNAAVAMFTHSVRTRANTVKFGHQAMCNPNISSLLKALRKGFSGNFPFMSIDGSVCFFVLYHYELNTILVKAIANVDDRSIYEAYREVFETLETNRYKPKMNDMDNQATKYIKIKKFLTKKECDLQVVEPHNHRVNAAERAIQTFTDAFIAALATTDRDFPLQL